LVHRVQDTLPEGAVVVVMGICDDFKAGAVVMAEKPRDQMTDGMFAGCNAALNRISC